MASYRSVLSQIGWPGSYPLDEDLYAQRYLIECCLSKLKQFREIATHFEKTAQNNRAVVTVTAIVLWIK